MGTTQRKVRGKKQRGGGGGGGGVGRGSGSGSGGSLRSMAVLVGRAK